MTFFLAISQVQGQQNGNLFYFEYPGSVKITGSTSTISGAVVIPSHINGKPVTEIGYNAFYEANEITSVTLPQTITKIGYSAFNDCDKLEAVNLPSSLTIIERESFIACNLNRITIPGSVYAIGDSAFASNPLERVDILDGVGIIGSGAFAENRIGVYGTPISKVIFPPSITQVVDSFRNRGLKTACFRGNAPMYADFQGVAAGFIVYYNDGSAGFTTPSWKGFHAFPGTPPTFTNQVPATAVIGTQFQHTCTVSGAPESFFQIASGALPDGLALNDAGGITGTPSVEGIFSGVIAAFNGIGTDANLPFTIDTRSYRVLTAVGVFGSFTGTGQHPLGISALLSVNAHPGYVFSGWTGDATGTANPLSVLMDADKTITATFGPDTNDTDEDGLTNYQEVVEYGTDPTKQDTDGDGVKDKADGRPLDPTETLDTDRDGTGDNADTDDDGDGYSDLDEINIHGTNPKRADSDGDGLSDPAELQTHLTNPNLADTDNDGLSDGAEVNTYGTLPKVGDTDGDGFLDGYEVLTGKSPLDILDKPALVAEARTAIEFTFPSALGKIYRIEDSFDLSTWGTVESGIAGNGSVIQRFYTTRNVPKRYFRVEDDAR
jgi:uncharacterized repeat protein (TIGR02543 family)